MDTHDALDYALNSSNLDRNLVDTDKLEMIIAFIDDMNKESLHRFGLTLDSMVNLNKVERNILEGYISARMLFEFNDQL
jgi:hypothetical protein